MTKREITILREFYDKAMADYMVYVVKKKNAPSEVLERACAVMEIYNALLGEVGA